MSHPEEIAKIVRPRRLELVGRPPSTRPWWETLLEKMGVFARRRPWFLVVVALPCIAAILYYGVIASDQYESESRFIIRSANQPQASALTSILQSTGFVNATDDALSVIDFIQSRDIVRKLERRQDLRAILARPEADFIDRFPPPFTGTSFERLYETYERFVDATYDATTGIVTLRVRAFRPGDSYTLGAAILGYSEDLINRLNERARADMVDVAVREIGRNEVRVEKAQAAITAYRLHTNMLDPTSSSTPILQLVGQLAAQRASSEEQLSELMRASPDSPQIEPLRTHVAGLETQIASERKKIVGKDGSIAQEVGAYERLALEREFADKGLAAANAALEAARVEAEHKRLYIERVVEPNLPDFPLYPHRLMAILEVLLSSTMLYGVGWLVTASIREHVGR